MRGGKLDLLAVDAHSCELAVIELKESKAKARQTDKNGRNAQAQAEHYASLLHTYRNELYPFFERLAHVLAKHYQGPPEIVELRIPANHKPHALVWCP
jgi:hypothetical protein